MFTLFYFRLDKKLRVGGKETSSSNSMISNLFVAVYSVFSGFSYTYLLFYMVYFDLRKFLWSWRGHKNREYEKKSVN